MVTVWSQLGKGFVMLVVLIVFHDTADETMASCCAAAVERASGRGVTEERRNATTRCGLRRLCVSTVCQLLVLLVSAVFWREPDGFWDYINTEDRYGGRNIKKCTVY